MCRVSQVRSSHKACANVPYFLFPVFSYPFQEGNLPGKKFDKLYAFEKFLEQLRSLIRPFHGLFSVSEERHQNYALYWGENDEDGKTSKSTRAKGGKQ